MDGPLLIVLLIGLMYVVLVLPRRRQMSRQRSLLASLEPGDDVVTIGGLHGTITEVDGPVVTLSVAAGVELRFAREAVASKVAPVLPVDAGSDDASSDDASSDDAAAGDVADDDEGEDQ